MSGGQELALQRSARQELASEKRQAATQHSAKQSNANSCLLAGQSEKKNLCWLR